RTAMQALIRYRESISSIPILLVVEAFLPARERPIVIVIGGTIPVISILAVATVINRTV
ncbi:hypothetical protein BU23DRAFT_562406, partial [Bimuria novae-zelandiae CBS 107.79]